MERQRIHKAARFLALQRSPVPADPGGFRSRVPHTALTARIPGCWGEPGENGENVHRTVSTGIQHCSTGTPAFDGVYCTERRELTDGGISGILVRRCSCCTDPHILDFIYWLENIKTFLTPRPQCSFLPVVRAGRRAQRLYTKMNATDGTAAAPVGHVPAAGRDRTVHGAPGFSSSSCSWLPCSSRYRRRLLPRDPGQGCGRDEREVPHPGQCELAVLADQKTGAPGGENRPGERESRGAVRPGPLAPEHRAEQGERHRGRRECERPPQSP